MRACSLLLAVLCLAPNLAHADGHEASGEAETQPLDWQARPDPLRVELPHDLWLTPVARLQVRATLFDQDDAERNDPAVYGDPGLREGFAIRRARAGLAFGWQDKIRLHVEGGWDNRYDALQGRDASFQLMEASVTVSPLSCLSMTLGQTRVPFGRQATASSAELALWERSMAAEHMAPAREMGFLVSGAMGPSGNNVLPEEAFRWSVGIFNGGGDWTGDMDPSPRLAGRVRLDLLSDLGHSEIGIPAGGFGISVGGSLSHNWGLEADTLSAGADIALHLWRFRLQGELLAARAEPTFDDEGIPELFSLRESLGWYGQLGVVIVPGILELAARVGSYDDNTRLDDAGDRLDIAGGLNAFFLDGRLSAQLNYVHRMETSEGSQTSNDSLILQMQARL